LGLLSRIESINSKGFTITLDQTMHGDDLRWAIVLKGNNTRLHRAGNFPTIEAAIDYIIEYVGGFPS
jgi:hypothetical protein